ncbi:MAG: hypothetical protein NWE95_00280 [Candidatus Bathyarchaeota archaeon]|nr:hypothetical protein [Candidatus Bathyarchaeota archaeon]
MSKRVVLIIVLLLVGAVLLINSLNIGFDIGSVWFGEQATSQWRMNNYIFLEAQYAYGFFGLATLAIGGLATGIALPAFFFFAKSRKVRIASAGFFFGAIILTGLGFNTLDFMLGCFYWTNMTYPPPVHVAVLGYVDVWNFYFYLFVVPLWLGGFLMGLAMSFGAMVHPQKALTANYALSKQLKLPGLIMQETGQPQEYFAESRVFTRKRKITKSK